MIRWAFPAVIFALAVTCPTTAIAQNITYFVEPTSLPDGYTIEGGHITTNGTLGALSASDILDYEVRVTGELPYVFMPSNPENAVNVLGTVNATSTTIEIPEILSPISPADEFDNWFSFNAQSGEFAFQRVRWYNIWLDLSDPAPDRHLTETSFINGDVFGGTALEVANRIEGESRSMLVATVPEPSGISVLLPSTILACLAVRKRSAQGI